MQSNPKTIAILTSTPVWPLWLEKAAVKLFETGNVQTIIHVYTPVVQTGQILKFSTALFRMLEARSYNAAGIDAFEPVDSKNVQAMPLENIVSYNIDIIICEGGVTEDMIETLRVSPCKSIWQFDENSSDGLPVNAARAMLKGKGYVMLKLNDITKPEVNTLYQTTSQICSLSLNRTIHQHFLKAALIPARVLKNGAQQMAVPDYTQFTQLTQLSWLEGCVLSALTFWRRMKQALVKHNDAAWALGILEHKNGSCVIKSLKTVNKILPLPDRFWADPFSVVNEGQYFLFFEEFKYAHGLGKIMVAEIEGNKFISAPVTALSEPRHLSYPHVFSHDNTWYMIPETGESERVDLYKANNFPYDWAHEKTLIKGMRVFDSTLYYHQDRWWLFGTIAEKGTSDYDELHIFHTDDFLIGGWTPHPMNPVISDVRCARPAGPLFEHKGRLYRPAQDSRERYGFGLVINEILELTPQTYRERIVESIRPDTDISGIRGIHTFSSIAGLSAIDFIQGANSKFTLKL